MGWLFYRKPRNVKAHLDEKWGSNYEVLDSAIVKFRTYYAAVHHKPSGDVYAGIFLLRYEGSDFGYKDMTEFCGPCESECPERILKLLTPIKPEQDPNGWAQAWRDRCWARINHRRQNKLFDGAIVELSAHYNIPGRGPCNTFTARRVGKRWLLDGWNLRGFRSHIKEVRHA